MLFSTVTRKYVADAKDAAYITFLFKFGKSNLKPPSPPLESKSCETIKTWR